MVPEIRDQVLEIMQDEVVNTWATFGERPWRLFKDPGLKLEFGKSKARAWELHQAFCEFVGEIG